MQYKGTGEDYVSILQRKFIGMMSDAEMGVMEEMFPVNTLQAKEELYYRKIHDDYFGKMVRGTR